MRRLGLPTCALAAILLCWLAGPEPAVRRPIAAIGAATLADARSGEASETQAPVATAASAEVRPKPKRVALLEGVIVDPEGRGVEGVTLTAHFARNGSSHYKHHLGFDTARSDGCGRFRMDAPPRAQWATLRIDAPGWVRPAARTVSADGTTLNDGVPADARALGLVRGEDWPPQKIVLERGSPVQGVVETAEGVRLADVPVEATWGSGSEACSLVHTDEHGRFSILVPAAADLVARARPGERFLPDGSPALPWEAQSPRFAETLTADAEARAGPVAPGASDVRMVLREIDRLRMRVLGPEGPWTGAVTIRVRELARPDAWTAYAPYVRDGELEYEAPRVTPGTYEIEVVPDADLLPARAVATLPGAPFDARLTQSLSIEGFLEGDDLKDFEITWTGPCNEGWCTLIAESAGFVLRGLADGAGDVYARREGDPRCVLVTGCRPGTGVLRLTLSEGRVIGGRVAGLEGLDPSALAVRAVRGLLDQYAGVRPDGTFSIVGLPPGAFRVELVTRGWSSKGLVDRWLHDARDGVETGTDNVALRVRIPATDPDGP
ncbi:MAG: hypothetical protein ACHQ1G_01365 [Planctomycetota bacterium]